MREFILLARKAWTSPFDPDDLVGAGRMDIVASFAANCLWISNNLRTDTICHAVLEGPRNPPVTVSFHGQVLKEFPYDTKGIAVLISQALKRVKPEALVWSSPGISIQKIGFEGFLKEQKKPLFFLSSKGEDIRSAGICPDSLFIIGDYIGVPDKRERFLEKMGAKKLSLGKTTLHASQCPIVIHYELDRQRATAI